jgi:hypothetical protein
MGKVQGGRRRRNLSRGVFYDIVDHKGKSLDTAHDLIEARTARRNWYPTSRIVEVTFQYNVVDGKWIGVTFLSCQLVS